MREDGEDESKVFASIRTKIEAIRRAREEAVALPVCTDGDHER